MNTEPLRSKTRRKAAAFLLTLALLLGLAAGDGHAATLTFAVGATNGVTNSQVVVPIRVTNFTSVGSFSFSFHWNTNVARFAAVEQFALAGMTTNNFGIFADGTITVAWDDPNSFVTNQLDGSMIFGVRLQF